MLMSAAAAGKLGGGRMVPLAVLLKKELSGEKIEKPEIFHGQANQSKKGEDFTLVKTECQRVPGDGVTTFSVFAVIVQLVNAICSFGELERIVLIQLCSQRKGHGAFAGLYV